ncbi:MAG: hypothetical protein U0133_10940 [Gemmatimonadales bacterium]
MAITGRITGKMDARWLIVTGVGALLLGHVAALPAHLGIGMSDTVFPMILRRNRSWA